MINPVDNLGPMVNEIIQYGALSGIHTNWDKSVLFPLTANTPQFTTTFPFKWATDPIRYLGIWLSRDTQLLWSENYGRLVTWIEEKIKKWKTLPLSLTGRIATLKMVILPKLLYLFTNLPLPIPKSFFTRL